LFQQPKMLTKKYIKAHEKELREAIVKEAYTCLKTPYHVLGQIKGVGFDCMTLLIEVYSKVGLIEWFKPPHYSPDFLLHRSEENYLEGVSKHGFKTDKYETGNIIVYKIGRVVSHSAIIVDYPTIIHSVMGKGCILDDASQDFLKKHEHSIYSFWKDK